MRMLSLMQFTRDHPTIEFNRSALFGYQGNWYLQMQTTEAIGVTDSDSSHECLTSEWTKDDSTKKWF